VAVLYGRIDALYLNAGRQFFGECAVHHDHITQLTTMTSRTEARLMLHMGCCVKVTAASLPQLFGNCAGDTGNSDMRQMQLVFETNFWGPVRVFQAALPLFPSTGDLASTLCAGQPAK
jgi:NAD(P)-dependent dehydrogenase (short-subunit alcohol dehydrogenase family)